MRYSPLGALSLVASAAWIVLLVGRGRFWAAARDTHLELPDLMPACDRERRVEAVVAARDEAPFIGRAVASLARQDFSGPLHVTVVDDASTDGTAEIARAAADAVAAIPVEVIRGRPLATPWTGKLNALDAGIRHVRTVRGRPDFWLFTDADIEHDAGNVAALVALARRDDRALVSLMVRLRCASEWERLLIPAFVFFFAKLYPFAWVRDPRRSTAAAAGGCVLIADEALERIGGLAAIGDRLIDDCALAAAVKRHGGRIWLGHTDRTQSIRPYETLDTLWSMVRRSAFVQLDRSYAKVAGTVVVMTVLYVVPPLLTIVGFARRDYLTATLGLLTWIAFTAIYAPTMRALGLSRMRALTLPIAAVLYTAMTIDSALAHARGRGGAWKGRVYASDV